MRGSLPSPIPRREPLPQRLLTTTLLGALALLTLCGSDPASAQSAQSAASAAGGGATERRPFFVGERLVYQVRVPRLGTVGRGAMTVEGPVDVRGQATYLLRSDFRTRIALVKAVNRSESWIDPRRMASLRFHKHERQPLSSQDQSVELFPERKRWEAADGTAGESASDAPLDELSFIYFVRTLPLAPDTTYRFDRYYDAARNPTTVRVVGRETVTTAAGDFRTLVVEMRVRDARRYRGEGVIRIHVTDDGCRIPVRIESVMPIVGTALITLESHTHPATHLASRLP
jgi:hypothetical protein